MKPVLLLVDDHEEILDFIANDLGELYTIHKATNGREALAVLEQAAIHLVISDVMMPVMDGFALCREIKSNFNHSHIPVILLTAKNTMQSKIEGLELGADAYVDKPFSPEFLQVQIANLLNNRAKVKEFFTASPLAHINTMAYTKADETFLNELDKIIQQKMENTEFDVDGLAREMNMSRPTLYRKIKEISNLTPNELINITRLKKASEFLASGSYKIYEVSDAVGFSSQTAFGRSFHKQFGMTPTEFISNHVTKKND